MSFDMSKELFREYVAIVLHERVGGGAAVGLPPTLTPTPVDIWDSSYSYSYTDGPEIVQSLLRSYGRMAGQGSSSVADPKFLNPIQRRLRQIGVPQEAIQKILLKLRTHAAKQKR